MRDGIFLQVKQLKPNQLVYSITHRGLLLYAGTGEQGTAPVRSYMLLPGEGVYGAELAYGWMLNLNMLEVIEGGIEFLRSSAPPWVLNKMMLNNDTKRHIYLDTNWLVSDGFECTDDNITSCICVAQDSDISELSVRADDCAFIVGRLNMTFSKHKRSARITGFSSFELWPPGVALSSWVPASISTLAGAGNLQLHADGHAPAVRQSLMGGEEFCQGDVLTTEASPFATRCYSFMEPGADGLQYIRLDGACMHGSRLKGYRMFDEDALRLFSSNPSTTALLATPTADRSILWFKYLLPGLDGLFQLEVDRSWLVEQVFTVSPQCSMGAKWALGVDGYFVFDHVVGEDGQLIPCPPLTRHAANDIERRLFVTACRYGVCLVVGVTCEIVSHPQYCCPQESQKGCTVCLAR